jgi:hypothetical protein
VQVRAAFTGRGVVEHVVASSFTAVLVAYGASRPKLQATPTSLFNVNSLLPLLVHHHIPPQIQDDYWANSTAPSRQAWP